MVGRCRVPVVSDAVAGGQLDAVRRPKNAVVVLLDSLNRHMLGAYGGREFDTPNLDAFAAGALRFEHHYSGSLPCMPARHDILVRRARFPVAAVGLDRDLGGAITWRSAPRRGRRRCWSPTIRTCSRSAARTTTPTSRLGVPARPRERPVEDAPRPELDRARRSFGTRGSHCRTTTRAAYFREEADFPGPRDDGGGGALARARTRGTTSASSCSSTSSTRTSRSTRRSRTRRCTTSWEGPHLIWPPYARGGAGAGRARRARRRARCARCYGAKLTMIDHWFGQRARRRSTGRRAVGRHRGHRVHRPRPLPRARRTSGASRRCRCTSRSGTSRCWSRWPGVAARARRRADDERRHLRDAGRPVRRRRRSTARTASRCCR